jgi:hypothetical protein
VNLADAINPIHAMQYNTRMGYLLEMLLTKKNVSGLGFIVFCWKKNSQVPVSLI